MPSTIAEVARRAGVSTATVSRALTGSVPVRPATRRRVMAAVDELGFRPSGIARSLKLRRTKMLGVIITDIENPYYPEIVRAVEDAARELDYALLLCNGADDPERESSYLEALAERRIDGIIIATSRMDDRHARWLARAQVPVVLMNSESNVPGIPAILSDNRAGGRIAAEHLLVLGHRAIGHITAPAIHEAAAPRLAGVRVALDSAGIGSGRLVVAAGDGHVAGGERAMDELLRRAPELTGVVCYNDLTAIGAFRSLRSHGLRIPGDVSVVGFDNLDLAAYVDPPLTTIVQQKAVMGRWAVERLAALIGGGYRARPEADDSKVVRLSVRLLVRASTGVAPGS
jgi:LacI family transcriptional regulator